MRLAVMPRYYFHLRNDIDTRDEEGQELRDLAEAHECALEAAREMCCADIKQGWLNLDHAIDVIDDQGTALFTITYREAFEVKGK